MAHYQVSFNEEILLKSSTKKDAMDFTKSLNKENTRIKSIIDRIEKKGGHVYNIILVDRIDNDYIYPIANKGI